MVACTCTHESHAAAKASFATEPSLRFHSLQFGAPDELLLVFVHCQLCDSTLALEPDQYAAEMANVILDALQQQAQPQELSA